MSDFQQTVDLKEKFNKDKAISKPPLEKKRPAKPAARIPQAAEQLERKRKAENVQSIDEVYNDHDEVAPRGDLRTFNRPLAKGHDDSIYKKLSIALALALVFVFVYFFLFRDMPETKTTENLPVDSGWYAVELINDQVYYGQVEDKSADPLLIRNVYYNYDQISEEGEKEEASANLRLVKRGKETHGPDGSMNIIRSQVLLIEPLKEDSKVLKAILDYEK